MRITIISYELKFITNTYWTQNIFANNINGDELFLIHKADTFLFK